MDAMHGHHGHAHDHHEHAHHHPAPSDKRYTIAIALNLGFVAIEGAAGFFANSTALLSDATPHLSHLRDNALSVMVFCFRSLYRTIHLPRKNPLKQAHANLDAAVLVSYAFSAQQDVLQQLLALHREVAQVQRDGSREGGRTDRGSLGDVADDLGAGLLLVHAPTVPDITDSRPGPSVPRRGR